MIPFSSAVGNLFNQLGAVANVLAQMRTFQGNLNTTLYGNNGVTAQLAKDPDIQAIAGGLYPSVLENPGNVTSTLQQIAAAAIDRAVYLDNPRPGQTLTNPQVLLSILEVIRQMKVQGATILQMTVTGTPVAVSNPGPNFTGISNGVINVSVKRPLDGLTLENCYAEALLFQVTSDSYTGGATAGNEPITVTGEGNTDLFNFDWPLGSGASTTINMIDGDVNNGSGNLLTNSGFATWPASNQPANFTINAGQSLVSQNTSITYTGGSSLQITGDGSTLLNIEQLFNSSSGTAGTLAPQQQYSFCIFMRRDGTAAGAGQLVFELVDGNGNIVNDANNVANTFTVNLTTLLPTWGAYTGVFRTPEFMPSSIGWRMRMPTGSALSNGRSVYLDKVSMGLMAQIGLQFPFVAAHAGSVPAAVNDYGQATITNSRGSGGTLNTFQTALFLLLNSYSVQNEILFPSSSSPTISDGLI